MEKFQRVMCSKISLHWNIHYWNILRLHIVHVHV